jgi:integrase
MPRKIKAGTLETRSARLRLPISRNPVFVKLAIGTFLGYRRNVTEGSWVVRGAAAKGHYWTKLIGLADDYRDANDCTVLTFWQAQDRARKLARSDAEVAAAAPPATVGEALAAYRGELRDRRSDPQNEARVRRHLPERLLILLVAALRTEDLKTWRKELIGRVAPATVNRLLAAFKAALNLAADNDERITIRRAWEIGLANLPDAQNDRNVILGEWQIQALIAAAYADSLELGLLVEVAAQTGARISQLAGLDVVDLHDGPAPRLMIPTSKKGRGTKKLRHYPAPLTTDLARRLREAAVGRAPGQPLLVKPSPRPTGRPNGGRADVIWTPERRAQLAILDQLGTLSPAKIAAALGVSEKAIAGLRWRQDQANKPRPTKLPARRGADRWGRSEHNRPFARIAQAAGLDPAVVTFNALRHSSIVRQLLARVSTRVVAAGHDTSVPMIEKTYSRHISDHADAMVRATLLTTTNPAPPAAVIEMASRYQAG